MLIAEVFISTHNMSTVGKRKFCLNMRVFEKTLSTLLNNNDSQYEIIF